MNIDTFTHYYDHPFPSDSHEGNMQNHEGFEGEKEEKSLGENRRLKGREERGETEENEEGRKGKQWLIMWPPQFQTSGSQSGGPQAKWIMAPVHYNDAC